jgi:hypothetical protein
MEAHLVESTIVVTGGLLLRTPSRCLDGDGRPFEML